MTLEAAVFCISVFGLSGADHVSCGASSFYMLCALNGEPIEVEAAQSALPDSVDGHSLAAISAAAYELARPILFMEIGREGRLPSGPLLVYWKPQRADDVGHVVCARILDERGRQLQVINPPFPPYLVEEKEFLSDLRFGGWVGIRDWKLERVRVFGGISVGALVIAVAFIRVNWLRRAS